MDSINDSGRGQRPYNSMPMHTEKGVGDGDGGTPRVTTTLVFTMVSVIMAPVLFGFSLGYTSPTNCAIKVDVWNQTDCDAISNEFSLFVSLPTIGAIVGAMVGGPLAEAIGRKKAVITCFLPFIVGFVLVGLAEYTDVLGYIGRFLQGVGTGISSSAVPIYIAEISPVHLRGALGACFQLSITLGFLLVYSLYSVDWRTLSYIGAGPGVVGALLMAVAPESPLYLLKRGLNDKAKNTLERLRGKTSNVSSEMNKILMDLDNTDTSSMTFSEKFRNLFQRSTLLPLAVGVLLMVLQQFSGINAVLSNSNNILTSSGVADANMGSIYVGLVQVVFTGVAAVIVDRAGRKPLLLLSATGMTLALVTMGLGFHYPDFKGASTMNLVCMMVYIASFSLGTGPLPWLIASEIYPSNVKGLCVSISVIANWICAFIILFTFESIEDGLGKDKTFWMFGGVAAIAVLVAILVVPETKGKNEEEIAALFRKHGRQGYRRI